MTDWFYISFVDPHRPAGQRFLGGCYVRAERDADDEARLAAERPVDVALTDEEMATMLALVRATRLGINPGGEAMVLGPLPDIDEHVPLSNRERLLTREEIT